MHLKLSNLLHFSLLLDSSVL